MNALKTGDVCSIMDSRERVDCVIASTRLILRGRNAGMTEYTLASLAQRKDAPRAWRVLGEKQLGLPTRRYTKDQLGAVINNHIDWASAQRKTEPTLIDDIAGYAEAIRGMSPMRLSQKVLPCSVTDNMMEKMCAEGWCRIAHGSGFMATNFVVAFTKELVRKGSVCICSDTTAYLDPGLKVYWRDVGRSD